MELALVKDGSSTGGSVKVHGDVASSDAEKTKRTKREANV
jgi:hypothetical protein